MASSKYHECSKLFFDIAKAQQFGEEIDKIAGEVTVQTGKRTCSSILSGSPRGSHSHYVHVGEHYYIEQFEGQQGKTSFYVKYNISIPKSAPKADVILARRKVDEYLATKYQELGPDTGISRSN